VSGAPPRRRTGAPRLPERTIWVNGTLCRGEAAAISLFDRGARDGEGLFETVRFDRGEPFAWERHLERLVLSAAELGFPVPPSPAVLREACAAVLAADALADAAVRITVTRGVAGGKPTRTGAWVEAESLTARLWHAPGGRGLSAMVSKSPFDPGPLGRHKTTSRLAYHLAREEARAARADEALLISSDGALLEGAVTNVFLVRAGAVQTPALSLGILPGIMRALVLRQCERLAIPAHETRLTLADLHAADEVFLTNAIQRVVPLARVDDRTLAGSEVGGRLRDALTGAPSR
jgi:branched-subunit amino acid aminotransferase/4-amino-4-deoxychorismate lyase